MLKHFLEYGKCVEISGFHNVFIEDTPKFLSVLHDDLPKNVEVQLIDADLVASWQHVYFAILNALMAHATHHNISKSLAIEVALYASAQRQIKKAITLIGIKPVSKNIAVILIGDNPKVEQTGLTAVSMHIGAQPNESVLELSDSKICRIKDVFGISGVELGTSKSNNVEQTLIDRVIERVALLSTNI